MSARLHQPAGNEVPDKGARGQTPRPVKPARARWRAIVGWLGRQPKATRLYLEVTHRCNLRCVACCTGAGTEKEDALSLKEQESVVWQARQMGAQVVSLAGSGEPLLYEGLFALIDYIRSLDMQALIYTNGTKLDRKAAEFLICRDVVVYFQLPSLRPDVLDRMTGKKDTHTWVEYRYGFGGATKAVSIPEGLKHLLEVQQAKGRRNLVRLEALMTKINYASLCEVARLTKELGLGLHLETLVFKGKAMENYDMLALTAREYGQLYSQLLKILGKDYLAGHRAYRCPVERNPVVWTNGDIAFCSSREAGIGNVRQEPLSKLFARARRLKRQEDRRIARQGLSSRYFHTCSSRRYYEARQGLSCEY